MKTKFNNLMVSFALMSILGIMFMAFMPGVQKPWSLPDKYKTMKNPTVVNTDNLNIGKMLYVKHCKACHGTLGKGDGPKAATLKTKMPDLTSKTYKALSPGEKYYRGIIGRDEMPNFETKIPEVNDRWYVLNYIETLK